jgi:hypothetical protein
MLLAEVYEQILRTGAFLLFPTKKLEVIGYALGRKNSGSINRIAS